LKALSEQLAFYQSYHRTRGCKITHVFGIPLVTFSILIPMGWVTVPIPGYPVSLAVIFVGSTLAYYFFLDRLLATLMTLCMIPLTWGALLASRLPFRESLGIFAATFVAGWVLQIVGHVMEGRRPALLDNFFQAVFTAPLFLLAEALISLGLKKPLGKEPD
jgi:uncharacterized membrane protein YGL010W